MFDFESFMMVRGLSVHVLTEQEIRLSELSETRDKNRPQKPYVSINILEKLISGECACTNVHVCE